MNTHFTAILVYTLLGFAVLYPFYFWFVPREKIDAGFYNFNLGLTGFIGGMGVVLAIATGLEKAYIFGISGWLALHLLISLLSWDREKISRVLISFSSCVGSVVFLLLALSFFSDDLSLAILFSGVVSQLILAGIIFAMILGHWYLNVIQLPIRLLQNTVNALALLLTIRLIWNVYLFSVSSALDVYGYNVSLWQFIMTLEGFILGVAFFFGLIVPIVLHFFIWRTVKLQATQSATGLLYVSVLSVVTSDLCYKYMWFQQGLFF